MGLWMVVMSSWLGWFVGGGCLEGDLSALEEKYCDLAKVEVDEMSGLMSDVGTKVPANNAVPCEVVLFQGLGGAVDSVLLHLLGHVRILDHCLPVRHLEAAGEGLGWLRWTNNLVAVPM